MTEDLGLVHMNGRIYDPLLGRFLSADVVVQYPDSLQSYNRYSYVRNNPLSSVDPTGFSEYDDEEKKSIWKKISEAWAAVKSLHENDVDQNSVQNEQADSIPGGAPTKNVLEAGQYTDKQLKALPTAAVEGAALAAADTAQGTAKMLAASQPGGSLLLNPVIDKAHASATSSIRATATESIVDAGGDPAGPGRAIGNVGGALALHTATILAPEAAAAGLEARAASLAGSVATESSLGRVFWSGRQGANRAAAEAFAEATGQTTLEMTTTGRALEAQGAGIDAWRAASADFARGASGEVTAFVGGSNPGSVWQTVEKPLLMQNPNVTKIIVKDAVRTEKTTTIYTGR